MGWCKVVPKKMKHFPSSSTFQETVIALCVLWLAEKQTLMEISTVFSLLCNTSPFSTSYFRNKIKFQGSKIKRLEIHKNLVFSIIFLKEWCLHMLEVLNVQMNEIFTNGFVN